MSRIEECCFKYLGLNVIQNGEGIMIDQKQYAKSLTPASVSTLQGTMNDAFSENEVQLLRSLSGQLLWVTSQTRPDVAYDSCFAGNVGKDPKKRILLDANKAIKKLKNQELQLLFQNLGNPEFWEIIVFCDASHASYPSGASQGGYLVFLKAGNKAAPIMWQSKRLHRVTKSPLASETMALAADQGYFLAEITQEIFNLKKKLKIVCNTDSKSLVDHLSYSKVIQDVRLRVDIARLREMVKLQEI